MAKVSNVVYTWKVACLLEQLFKEEYCKQNRIYGIVQRQQDFVYRTRKALDSPAIADLFHHLVFY